jgi:hypothetical protein
VFKNFPRKLIIYFNELSFTSFILIVLVFFEQIVAYLMVTSGTAVFEILYLAYNGDREVVWSEALSSYGKFCYRVKVQ